MAKKCIIIGSGLGGLSCGVILSKNGYDVTVLEQCSQIGGCLQCFTRKGVKFETGMHFIGSAEKGQTLYKLLKYLEVIDEIQLSRLNPDGYDIISFEGKQFNIANGRTNFINTLAAYFPNEKRNLERYYDVMQMVANASSLHSLRHAESDASINTEYQTRSINNVLDELIDNPMLKSVLSGSLPLYAAEKDKTPFSTHAFIMDFYNQSAWRIIGGSDKVGVSLAQTIQRYGGKVLTRMKVKKILCNDTYATGVLLSNGEKIDADIIISDAHPNRTLEMLDTHLIRPAFRKRIMGLRNTTAGFSVYLHFKKNTVPYMNSNFYSYRANTPWNCEHYNESNWPKGYLYMHFCHQADAMYAESGVVLSYMSIHDLKKWENTFIGHRGADYEAFKQYKAEKLIEELNRDFPGIRNNIEHIYTSTPLTYRDYTGTEGGSMYGIAKDITAGVSCRVPQRTKVPNVLLTGQNINSHGMLGVLVGTIVTCSELLTAETIYRQIVEANK